MTKYKQTEPYNASQIAGRVGQLIGWLQFVFIPILLILIFEKYNSVSPLPLAGYTVLLLIMMVILIFQGRVLENLELDLQKIKNAAIWSIAAASAMLLLYLPILVESSIMYGAAIICYIRAYRSHSSHD